jgi:hypothetical protein
VIVEIPWAVRTATTPTKSDPLLRAFFKNSSYLLEAKSALRAFRNSALLTVARLRALLLMVSLFTSLNLFEDGELFSTSQFCALRDAATGLYFRYQHSGKSFNGGWNPSHCRNQYAHSSSYVG